MSDKEEPKRGKKYRALKLLKIAERRAAVAQKYKEGLTMERIAQALNCDPGTVCRDIHKLIADLGRTAGLDINARIALELDKINLLEAEAWESLKVSQQPKFVSSASETVTPVKDNTGAVRLDGAGQPMVAVERRSSATEIKRPEGDPRWAGIIIGCITRRMKLFGLEGGRGDEEDAKKSQAKTFTDFVAEHLAAKEATSNFVTKATRPAAVPLDPSRLP